MVEQLPSDSHDPLAVLRKFEIKPGDFDRHVSLPDHLKEATERIFAPELDKPFRRKISSIFSFLFALNTRRFEERLHQILSPCVMGYSLELRESGAAVFSRQWRWAKSDADGRTTWTRDTPMHLASVSKLITAMALSALLDERGVSHDTRIAPWLPQFWPRGANIDALTFRHLLSHRSGLLKSRFPNAAGPCDYQAMKDAIAAGTNDLRTRDYKNINYSLCRVLLATVQGDVHPSFLAGPSAPPFLAPLFGVRDSVWDLVTIHAYEEYVNDRVFTPASVAPHAFDHTDACALAYGPSPDAAKGWNSSDLRAASAAVGWHLSVNEMLRVMATFRRAGTIMSASRARRMLDSDFGVDIIRPTRLGTVFAKGGWWQSNDGKVEQSNAFLLPGEMELVILANSPSCNPTTSFFEGVARAIDECSEPWIARLWR